MWVEDFPPETARLLRLADVCGATGVFVFAIIGVALCLGGAGAYALLFLRFMYRHRSYLFTICIRRCQVVTTSTPTNPESPVTVPPDSPLITAPEGEIAPSPRSSRRRPKKVGVLELFYPTPVSPRLHAASHYPHLSRECSNS